MPLTARKILLIDDDHDIRVIIRQTLESEGYLVQSVANGRDALKNLQLSIPDLIILDMAMPLMNGEDFLKAKENVDSIKNIPVLVISAHEDKLKIVDPNPSLKKPFDMHVFLNKIPEMLNQKIKPRN